MFNKEYMTKLVGGFIFVFGLFFLLLAITNIFNGVNDIQKYKSCVSDAIYSPANFSICKADVSNSLGITIRADQVEITTGQYLKVYFMQIIEVLFAVLLIIIGDFVYFSEKRKEKEQKKVIIKAKKVIAKKKVKRKK